MIDVIHEAHCDLTKPYPMSDSELIVLNAADEQIISALESLALLK